MQKKKNKTKNPGLLITCLDIRFHRYLLNRYDLHMRFDHYHLIEGIKTRFHRYSLNHYDIQLRFEYLHLIQGIKVQLHNYLLNRYDLHIRFEYFPLLMMIQKVKYHVIICTWKLHYQVSRNWEREVCFCLFWWHYFSLSSFSQPSTWEMTWDSMIMKPMKTQSHTTDAMPKTHDKNFWNFWNFFLFVSKWNWRAHVRTPARTW